MKLSIIVAIYNIEQYIKPCIDSLLAANLSDCEILLIDDGSTDRSGKKCDEYINENVHVFHKENGGLSDARNFGLERAIGELVIFVDGDDTVVSEKLAVFIEQIDNTCDIIMNDYFLYNCQTGKTMEICQVKNTLEQTLKQPGVIWNVWRYAYKREYIKNIRFRIGYLAEDLDFTIHVLTNASVKCIHAPYYIYACHRSGSIMQVASIEYIRHVNELIREHYARLGRDKLSRLLKKKLLRDYFINTSKYYDYPLEDRVEFWRIYKIKGSPVPFNATLIAPLMVFLRRLYHFVR